MSSSMLVAMVAAIAGPREMASDEATLFVIGPLWGRKLIVYNIVHYIVFRTWSEKHINLQTAGRRSGEHSATAHVRRTAALHAVPDRACRAAAAAVPGRSDRDRRQRELPR